MRGMRKDEDAARHRGSRRDHRRVREQSFLHQRRRWSILPRSIEGDSNCGKSRSAAGVNRWQCAFAMHARSESAQPVKGRQQWQRVQAVPFHAHTTWHQHGTATGSLNSAMGWNGMETLGPRKFASSRETTPPIDCFNATMQLNARDGLANGRASELTDEDACVRAYG